MIDLNLNTATRIGLNCLGLLGAGIALRLGETVFIPLTMAVLLSAILWPVVSWLNRRRIPWTMASFIAVGLLLALFAFVTLGFALAVPKMIEGLPNPNSRESQLQFYRDLRYRVQQVSPGPIDRMLPEDADNSTFFQLVKRTFENEFVNWVLPQLTKYFSSWLLQLVLIMFVTLFLLVEGRMLTQRIVEMFGPSPATQAQVAGALAMMAESIRTYLVWRTIVNIGLGLLLGLVYQGVGLKQAWTWAMVAAILCYVPYIGTIIASVPPVLDAFIFVGPWESLAILIFYAFVVTVEGYLIVPVVMGRSMDLNATTVILSCLFWDLVWGTPGLFLAMPLMAGVKAVCLYVPGWRPIANLLGTEIAPLPAEMQAKDQPVVSPNTVPMPDADRTVVIEETKTKSPASPADSVRAEPDA